MEDKIKRQKIMERDRFTYEDKLRFAAKSDGRCCHCGKKVHIGYGATVEHFVPLSKGGTNRDINIIMLCDECNQKKSNMIVRPKDYIKYLHQEDYDKLCGYFDSYISSFEFIDRHNLLSCDAYQIFMVPNVVQHITNSKMKNKLKIPYIVKRATYEDIDRLSDYYIKYLKKYDCLDSESAAKINISFWLRFGCIYYIEKNNDIQCFITLSVTHSDQDTYLVKDKDISINDFITMNIFCYYSNDYNSTLIYNLSRQVPRFIMEEQKLCQLPTKFSIIHGDSLAYVICKGGTIIDDDNARLMESFCILYNNESGKGYNSLPDIDKDDNLKAFFNKFERLKEPYVKKWFTTHGSQPMKWLVSEIVQNNEEGEEDS